MEESKKAELADLILKGRKIEAVRLYRESTGMGLKDSKEAVEALEKEMREEIPEKFMTEPGGCAGVVLLGIVCLGGMGLALY